MVSGVRNATTVLRALLSNEPVETPLPTKPSRRGEFLLYAAIVIVLALLLLRVRRKRIEREEEERLNAIRRQQAAYSPPAGSTGSEGESDAQAEQKDG